MFAAVDLKSFEYISTVDSSAACGVTLQVGKTYVIYGSLSTVPHLVSCGSIIHRLETVPTPEEAQKMAVQIYDERCVVRE